MNMQEIVQKQEIEAEIEANEKATQEYLKGSENKGGAGKQINPYTNDDIVSSVATRR